MAKAAEQDKYKEFRLIEVGAVHPGMDHIANMFQGFQATSVIMAACKLEVFDKLHDFGKPVTVQEVVKQTKWPEQATERLFDALVSLKLLDKSETSAYIGTSAAGYLRKAADISMWGSESFIPLYYEYVMDLPKFFRGEKTAGSCGGHSEEGHGHGHSHDHGHGHSHDQGHGHSHDHGHGQDNSLMHGSEDDVITEYKFMESMTKPYVQKLVTTIDLSSYKSYADLAAGSGVVGLQVAKTYPHMQVNLLELPQSAEILRKLFVPKSGCTNVKVLEVDCFKDELPKADVYSVGNFVHHWKPQQIEVMMNKLYKSINPGGVLIVFEKCMLDAKDGPPIASLLDVFMIPDGDGLRSFAEYKAIFESYGFKDCGVVRESSSENDAIYCKRP